MLLDIPRCFKMQIFCTHFLQVQGKDPSVDITQDVVDESEEDRFEELPEAATPIELPPCEISKLEEITELFCSALQSPIKREKLAIAIEKENYIRKLIELFCICEDLENTESLHYLYEIMKNTILLNKTSLLEILFSDELIYDVVGCLEHDPSATDCRRHREYLNSKANFHEVIPITNTNLLNKIHQTYRVQYIQDVILPTPSVFEENMLSTLSSFVFFNKVDIVDMIQVRFSLSFYVIFVCVLLGMYSAVITFLFKLMLTILLR